MAKSFRLMSGMRTKGILALAYICTKNFTARGRVIRLINDTFETLRKR